MKPGWAISLLDRAVVFFFLAELLVFFFVVLGNLQEFTIESHEFLLSVLSVTSYCAIVAGIVRLAVTPLFILRKSRVVLAALCLFFGVLLFFVTQGIRSLTRLVT